MYLSSIPDSSNSSRCVVFVLSILIFYIGNIWKCQDEQVKSLLKSYLDKKTILIISCKSLKSEEGDSLNYFPNTEKIPIIFLYSIEEERLIEK